MNPLANPYWRALTTQQKQFAIGSFEVCRFSADVIPFAGMQTPDVSGLSALRALLAPDERVWIALDGDAATEPPATPGLKRLRHIPGLRMVFEGGMPAFDELPPVKEMNAAEAPAMLGLTVVAFPGFFRSNTCQLGTYLGIEVDGQLVAMAGERLAVPGYREVSAVCTHPAHIGRGYATTLIRHLLRRHAAAGLRSFLQLAAANERALGVYQRLGFQATEPVQFHQLQRQ